MAITSYRNVAGTNGTAVELIAPGDSNGTIKSIMISNTSADADAAVKLKLENTPTSGAALVFTLINTTLPSGAVLLIDDPGILSFDNSKSGFGLYIVVGSSDAVSVFINT